MTDREWMEPALAALFERCADNEVRAALRDDQALADIRDKVDAALDAGPHVSLPKDERGSNLFQGLIALRLKFPRQEAEQKLALNLAMRAHRPNAG